MHAPSLHIQLLHVMPHVSRAAPDILALHVQPLYSNRPDMRFHAQPLDGHAHACMPSALTTASACHATCQPLTCFALHVQPLYSNGPDMRFHAQPLDEHSCLVRLEARNIAWPHVKFHLHLLGSAPSNADPIAALMEENESLRRDLQAVTASFFRLHKKVEGLQAAVEGRQLHEAAREHGSASCD